MKAVIWGYKYADFCTSWKLQLHWMINALKTSGVDVCIHSDMKVENLAHIPKYDSEKDKCDICVYNHADISHLVGNVIPTKKNWFFKPTVPDEFHTTLDALGYGPYSSITYEKPPFEYVNKEEVKTFFKTKVKDWIGLRKTKWGEGFIGTEEDIPYNDYYLILGQCGGDSVVTRMDFGSYFTKLEQVAKELTRIDSRQVVIKLHPWTDGEFAKDTKFSENMKGRLESIDPKIKVYLGKLNVHAFIKKARCVLLANTGAGFETMMQRKPIISWGFPEYHWITYDLRHLSDLIRAIKLDWFDVKKQDKFLYWYTEKYCFFDQESANRRVKELLK